MGKVIAVCISEKKGTQKHPVEEAEFVEDWGIKNDAHAGKCVPEWKQACSIVGAKYVNFLHAAFDIIFRVFATFGQSTGGVRQTADNGRTFWCP